jgi:hypothetical protein
MKVNLEIFGENVRTKKTLTAVFLEKELHSKLNVGHSKFKKKNRKCVRL